jgi:hypothetical protein
MPPDSRTRNKKRTNIIKAVSSEKQLRFHGQAPPSTTGWKVQKPPSAGVLRLDRSIASAWACSRVIGVAGPDSSVPGLGVPGPATHTCCRTSSRSEWLSWM